MYKQAPPKLVGILGLGMLGLLPTRHGRNLRQESEQKDTHLLICMQWVLGDFGGAGTATLQPPLRRETPYAWERRSLPAALRELSGRYQMEI